jgi:hypothetical protein
MIGTYNTNKTINIILTERDCESLAKDEFINGRVIILEEDNRQKPLRMNIVNHKLLGVDCEVHDSYEQQNVFLTRKKLSELFDNGKIELSYIDEYKKNGKMIEFLYTEKNEDAKILMDKVSYKM